jgi:hypothetical protein
MPLILHIPRQRIPACLIECFKDRFGKISRPPVFENRCSSMKKTILPGKRFGQRVQACVKGGAGILATGPRCGPMVDQGQ